jgi:hypothetical protein
LRREHVQCVSLSLGAKVTSAMGPSYSCFWLGPKHFGTFGKPVTEDGCSAQPPSLANGKKLAGSG